jgi:hypothetical protein
VSRNGPAAIGLGVIGAIVGAVAGYVIAVSVVLPSNADLAETARDILPSDFQASAAPSYVAAPFFGASYEGTESLSGTTPTQFDALGLTAEHRFRAIGWTPWNSTNREGYTSSYGDRPGLRATLTVRARADGGTQADVTVQRVDFLPTVWLPTSIGAILVGVSGALIATRRSR